MSQLRFLHANVRSWRANGCELSNLARELDASVVSLNETWLRPGLEVFDTEGFQCFRSDRLTHGGGVALLVRDDIPVTPVDVGQGHLQSDNEFVACRLHLGAFLSIVVASIYCPPGVLADRTLFSRLANHDNLLLLGDFNAKCPALGSRGVNASGPALVDAITDFGLCLLSKGDPTHTAPSGLSDQLDLVLASAPLAHRVEDVLIGPDFGSDHLPVIVDFAVSRRRVPQDGGQLRFDFRHADWPAYQEGIEDDLGDAGLSAEPLATPLDVDRLYGRIVAAINRASKRSVPQRQPGLIKAWKMSAELLRVIRARRRMRRLWMQTRLSIFKTAYNRLSRRRNVLIAEAKRDSLQAFCDRLQRLHHTSSRDFWRSFKNLESGSQGQKSRRVPPLLRADGSFEVNDDAKAAMFADNLSAAFRTRCDANMDADWKEEVETFVSLHEDSFHPLPAVPAGSADSFTDISPEDVQKFAAKLPMKAPGPDGILNPFLRNGGSCLFGWLALLFTASLRLGYYPKSWKLAKIIMIKKQGKDPHHVSGLRPISLLPGIARFLEKIMAMRFLLWMEQMGILPLHQSSCRSARQTSDHLFRLAHDVMVGFARNQVTVASFLDIEGAFDSVWHDGLRYKLAHSGLPASFVRWMSDLLRNRRFFVQIGQDSSSVRFASAGVPQGSPLSPLCFVFYMADMPFDPDYRVVVSTFADDIALSTRSRQPAIAAARLQGCLDNIASFCRKWRLKLKPEKCTAICFTRRHQIGPFEIYLEGNALQKPETVKFLGVVFDKRLTFAQHIRRVRDAAFQKLNALKVLAGRGKGLNSETLIAVYLVFIRTFMDYGCCAWLAASLAHVALLQRVQNRALRIALRLPLRTRITDLHDMAGIPPIS